MSIRDRIERSAAAHAGVIAWCGYRVGVGGTEMTARVRVFVVDDHALFRSGVKAEIGDAVDIVGDVGTVDEAIVAIRVPSPMWFCSMCTCPVAGGERSWKGSEMDCPTRSAWRCRSRTRPRT